MILSDWIQAQKMDTQVAFFIRLIWLQNMVWSIRPTWMTQVSISQKTPYSELSNKQIKHISDARVNYYDTMLLVRYIFLTQISISVHLDVIEKFSPWYLEFGLLIIAPIEICSAKKFSIVHFSNIQHLAPKIWQLLKLSNQKDNDTFTITIFKNYPCSTKKSISSKIDSK